MVRDEAQGAGGVSCQLEWILPFGWLESGEGKSEGEETEKKNE